MYDVVIIGAGPAGLTSAIYACRAGLSVKVFEELSPGGQAAVTPEIENYPGMKKVSGSDFAISLFEQVTELGAEVEFERVVGIEITDEGKKVITDSKEYVAKAVIIATTIEATILSVINQTYSNIEVIVVEFIVNFSSEFILDNAPDAICAESCTTTSFNEVIADSIASLSAEEILSEFSSACKLRACE